MTEINKIFSQEYMSLEVGSLVTATIRRSAVNKKMEVGVVYDVYSLSGQRGVSILFESGGYDGWSLEEFLVGKIRALPVEPSKSCSTYRFESVGKLYEHYIRGLFDIAFNEALDARSKLEKQNRWWWNSAELK